MDSEDSDKTSLAETCAELLGIFEFHTNNQTKNKLLQAQIANAKKKRVTALKDTMDWLPYSSSYLRELLFFSRGRTQIEAAIKRLIKKKFLFNNCPNEITNFYSANMNWYKLNLYALNALADAVTEGVMFDIDIVPEKPNEKQTQRETIDSIVADICAFHEHINAISLYVYNQTRFNQVRKRFTERKKQFGAEETLKQCVLAILVNSVDDFYQARDPRNTSGKVLNWLEHIFGSDKSMMVHLDKAKGLGLTGEIALAEFQAFKSGGISKFSKDGIKQAQKADEAQSEVLAQDLADYRRFARKVAQFFADGAKAEAVFETILQDSGLHAFGEQLTVSAHLEAEITKSVLMFDSAPSEQIKNEIKKFSQTYADYNSANAED